jgi:hypothetical protein
MAKKQQPPAPTPDEVLEAEVSILLEQPLGDEELRQKLEALAAQQAFNGLTYLWGPELYRRNRVMFRPFILNHFGSIIQSGWNFKAVRWKDHAKVLDAWLEDVDRRNDVELFQRLYPWKHPFNEWARIDSKQWAKDLLARFQAAKERYERTQTLNKFDIRGAGLDEKTAVALYQIDPAAARPFLLKHPPGRERWSEERGLPEKLCAAAQQQGDEKLYFALYRMTVPQKTWEKEVESLAKTVQEPGRLLEELEKRHPQQTWGLDLNNGFYSLAKTRGRDVVPYLMKHLDSLWIWGYYGRNQQNKLLEHARGHQWWDIWSILIRKSDNKQYNEEVLALVKDRKQPDEVIFRRLVMLSGASSEWNWGRFAWQQIQYLQDKTAVALYERFPELIHGPFRKHLSLSPGWWGTDGLPKLTEMALKNEDTVVIDYLAGEMVRMGRYAYLNKKLETPAERLCSYYEKLRAEPVTFARRVASVLGQIPAYSIGQGYQQLLEINKLARLFFVEARSVLLEDPRSLRDLLEAAEIHVQLLALRVLAQDDERARRLAAENLDLLQATLLRDMHRTSRLIALSALANAATTPDNARTILARAKQALDLPDKGYPKEHLFSLLAELYQRWPDLRGPKEQLIVYRGKPRRKQWA